MAFLSNPERVVAPRVAPAFVRRHSYLRIRPSKLKLKVVDPKNGFDWNGTSGEARMRIAPPPSPSDSHLNSMQTH